jgi:hypothetical protein
MEKVNDYNKIDTCNNEDESLNRFNTHHIYIVNDETVDQVTSSELTDITENSDRYVTELYSIIRENNIEIYNIDNNVIDIIKRIKFLIEGLCDNKNITIYILLPYKSRDFIRKFNIFLHNLRFKYYSNVIIFNFIDNSTVIRVNDIDRQINEKLKKNEPQEIYFFNEYYYLTAEFNIKDLYNVCVCNIYQKTKFKKFFKVLNVGCGINGEIIHNGIIKSINDKFKDGFKFINNDELYNKDFLDDLVKKHTCSQGKLVQFTGTCWINAILNSILLPKKMRKIMSKQAEKYFKKMKTNSDRELMSDDEVIHIDLSDMSIYGLHEFKDDLTITQILTVIIYDIFVLNKRPSISDYVDTKRSIKYSNFILILAYKFIKKFYLMYRDLPDEKIIDTGVNDDTINKTLQYISNEYLVDFKNYLVSVFIDGNIITIPFKMRHLDKIYDLISCSIVIEYSDKGGGHSICGYICDDIQYVFDSNHSVLIESRWVEHNFDNYIKYIEDNTNLIIHKIYIVSINFLLNESHMPKITHSDRVLRSPSASLIELPIETCYGRIKQTTYKIMKSIRKTADRIMQTRKKRYKI